MPSAIKTSRITIASFLNKEIEVKRRQAINGDRINNYITRNIFAASFKAPNICN